MHRPVEQNRKPRNKSFSTKMLRTRNVGRTVSPTNGVRKTEYLPAEE
jgi:hypothetical protein